MKYLFFLLFLLSFESTAKLDFQSLNYNGKQILKIQDSKSGGFESGDSYRLKRVLSRYKYNEVWLKSGGGNLLEGVKIGLLLRQYGSIVKVKKGDSCVSACTVAFMGGIFRQIEKGGTYKVHAYSGISDEKNLKKQQWDTKASNELGKIILAYADRQMHENSAFWGALLFEYFRLMIQPLPVAKKYNMISSYSQRPKLIGDVSKLENLLKISGAKAYKNYTTEQYISDKKRIKQQGVSAAHDIAMRLERDAIGSVLETLQVLDSNKQLGHRAKFAIRMLETMFQCNIKATCSLNPQTLKEYGYTNVFTPI